MKDWKKEFNKKCLQHIDDGGLMKTHEIGEYPVLDLKLLENHISNLLAQAEQRKTREIVEMIKDMEEEIYNKLYDWDAYPSSDKQAKEIIKMIIKKITNLKEK